MPHPAWRQRPSRTPSGARSSTGCAAPCPTRAVDCSWPTARRGEGGVPARFVGMRNAAASPYRYLMDPIEQLRVMLEIDDADEVVWAIVHSHVASPARPVGHGRGPGRLSRGALPALLVRHGAARAARLDDRRRRRRRGRCSSASRPDGGVTRPRASAAYTSRPASRREETHEPICWSSPSRQRETAGQAAERLRSLEGAHGASPSATWPSSRRTPTGKVNVHHGVDTTTAGGAVVGWLPGPAPRPRLLPHRRPRHRGRIGGASSAARCTTTSTRSSSRTSTADLTPGQLGALRLSATASMSAVVGALEPFKGKVYQTTLDARPSPRSRPPSTAGESSDRPEGSVGRAGPASARPRRARGPPGAVADQGGGRLRPRRCPRSRPRGSGR